MENGLLYILAFSAMAIALFACIMPQAQLYSEISGTPKLSPYNYIISTANGYTWAQHRNGSVIWNQTDSYTVIENAVNDTQNAAIFLTTGTYNLSHGIKLHYNLGFKGEGITRTTLQLNDNVNESVLTYAATSNVASFIHVSDLFLYGNGANQASGHGINFYHNGGIVMDATIERVWVSSAKENGIRLYTTWGTKLTDCLSEFNYGNGVYWYNPTQEYINNLFSESNGGNGVYFQGGTGVMSVNIQSLYNPCNIKLLGLTDSMFTNIRSTDNNGSVSIYFKGAKRIMVNNLFESGTSSTSIGVLFESNAGDPCVNNTITNAIIHSNLETWGIGILVDSDQVNTRFTGTSVYNNNYLNIEDSGINTIIEW